MTQYHFTAWPDHGVPDYATPILAFHRRVRAQHHPSRGPMVVHCRYASVWMCVKFHTYMHSFPTPSQPSAGVGRTGTFIVIDHILEQIEKEKVVDIPGAITKIRQKRMKMVQTHVRTFSLLLLCVVHSLCLQSRSSSHSSMMLSWSRSRVETHRLQPPIWGWTLLRWRRETPRNRAMVSSTSSRLCH